MVVPEPQRFLAIAPAGQVLGHCHAADELVTCLVVLFFSIAKALLKTIRHEPAKRLMARACSPSCISSYW